MGVGSEGCVDVTSVCGLLWEVDPVAAFTEMERPSVIYRQGEEESNQIYLLRERERERERERFKVCHSILFNV